MNLLQTVNQLQDKRFSPRDFSDKAISEESLLEILEAVRQAPSCFNEQPWRFVYALKEDSENFQRFLSSLAEKNQQWAKQASVLMLAVAKTSFTANDRLNRHAWYDTGGAVSMLTQKATAMDVYLHQMAGFDAGSARELLQIPDGYEPIAMIALGYLDDEQKTEKPRLELSEITFRGKWGA